MEFDPHLIFETFVVGPSNQLAVTAARRTAEDPGGSYNPLFLYSASGLGKTHLLSAIAQYGVEHHPDRSVLYRTLKEYLSEFEVARKDGDVNSLRDEYGSVGILLLDDVQLLTGHPKAQKLLFKTFDDLIETDSQIVLASDRPPSAIKSLDRRLRSWLSGGLIVDLTLPDPATRRMIVRKKAEVKEVSLATGVARTLAKLDVASVKELQEAFDRLVAKQASERRVISAHELAVDLGLTSSAAETQLKHEPGPLDTARRPAAEKTEAATSKSEPQAAKEVETASEGTKAAPEELRAKSTQARAAPAKPEVPTEKRKQAPERPEAVRGQSKADSKPATMEAKTAPRKPASKPVDPQWRTKVEEVVNLAKADSISPGRLLGLLRGKDPPDDLEAELEQCTNQLQRVRDLRDELEDLGNPWPEAAATLLTTTDRLEEAESLLMSARERMRQFLPLSDGPGLRGLGGRFPALAVKAAEQLIRADPSVYNPLYVHSSDPERSLALLHAAGRTHQEVHSDGIVAETTLEEFQAELGTAISAGVAGAWRERWWNVDLLLFSGVEDLAQMERGAAELYHLLEALSARGARIVLAADRPPAQIEGAPERLADRFQAGLVVDLGGDPAATGPKRPPVGAAKVAEPAKADVAADSDAASGTATPNTAASEAAAQTKGAHAPAVPVDGGSSEGDDLRALRNFAGVSAPGTEASPEEAPEPPSSAATDSANTAGDEPWLPSPEQVVWDWPVLEELIADDEALLATEGLDGD